jgi:hypothetical protein
MIQFVPVASLKETLVEHAAMRLQEAVGRTTLPDREDDAALAELQTIINEALTLIRAALAMRDPEHEGLSGEP